MPDPSRVQRYALYFAPAADSAWDRFGATWLGRSAHTGERFAQPDVPGMEAGQVCAMTEAPRRYGFHATLKAPFRLAAGCTPEGLLQEMSEVFGRIPSFGMPTMKVVVLDRFLALVPDGDSTEINRMAEQCVTRFDRYRQPAGAAEIARRRSAQLTPREDEHLLRWGYPYVLESFRFHMSLTGPLGPESDATALGRAAARLMPGAPMRFDAVTLFREPSPGADFLVMGRALLLAP